MWNPSQHSADENVRWSWLRATEWVNWPLFLSQPVIPILLYFYDWAIVLGGLLIICLFWRALIVPFWVSPTLASIGVYFVQLKFLTAPIMAWLLWQREDLPLALTALLWPIFGPALGLAILIVPDAMLSTTPLGRASQIGPIQKRLLISLGYASPSEGGDSKSENP